MSTYITYIYIYIYIFIYVYIYIYIYYILFDGLYTTISVVLRYFYTIPNTYYVIFAYVKKWNELDWVPEMNFAHNFSFYIDRCRWNLDAVESWYRNIIHIYIYIYIYIYIIYTISISIIHIYIYNLYSVIYIYIYIYMFF